MKIHFLLRLFVEGGVGKGGWKKNFKCHRFQLMQLKEKGAFKGGVNET